METVALFRRAGHDALTVVDQSMGGATDGRIVTVCRDEARILVTLDMDFADIRAYAPADYRGLVVLRPWSHERQHVLSLAKGPSPLSKKPVLKANSG